MLAAGCTTTPRQPSEESPADRRTIQDNKRTPAAIPAPALPPPPKVAMVPQAVIPPSPTRTSPPVAVPPPAAPEPAWVSLNRWAALRGFGPPRKVASSPLGAYAFGTTNGMLVVQIGSLSAYWDRMEFRLGFPPRITDDQVFINSLDLRKNVEPLLRGLSNQPGGYRTIVIDPGHGGTSVGTRSVADGRYEKDFTLDWARRLAPLLEQSGWQVWLTRDSDVDVALQDRVAFADAHHADLFVSLHFNSPGDGGSGREAAGLETYCVTPIGMASTLKREFPDEITQFFPNNAYDEQNVQFAARIHRGLLTVNGDADRGVRRARFLTVLRGQRRPAVLIEGGYLSNQREAKRISDSEYRQALAEGVAKALAGIPARSRPQPEPKPPVAVVENRKPEPPIVKPEPAALKPETNRIQTAEAPGTNAFLRLMTTQPTRLHSPRNAP